MGTQQYPEYPTVQAGEDLRDPAAALCELVHRRTGFRIPKADIEAMFLAEWVKLSTLAHAIHREQQRKAAHQLPQQVVNHVDHPEGSTGLLGGVFGGLF
jgi:hypothetical protein